MPLPTPPVIPQPFANNAGGSFKNAIPNTTLTPGLASYDLGFPPLTMQPEISGGIPPFGQDFNGILNALSVHLFLLQAGMLYVFNSSVATAIGGYKIGAMLASTDRKTVWLNIVDNNSNDPDAGGAGWVPAFTYGYTTKSGLTGGTVVLTPDETRRGVIVLTGVLASPLAIVLPTTLQTWLIVNATSGAFTTTVRTAGGTGVVVPQGGFAAPVGVYGDGTNINPTVSPLSVPIDQSPTPDTLAERTSAGYLLATKFNDNSALENPMIGAVIVENAAADGFFRKISLANFLTDIFADAALTGNPTAPTPAPGDDDTSIATTAFVQNAVGTGPTRTWHDETGSRVLATNYTNTSGTTIQVLVSIVISGVSGSCHLILDGIDFQIVGNATGGALVAPFTFDVPPGVTYQIYQFSPSISVVKWLELRP